MPALDLARSRVDQRLAAVRYRWHARLAYDLAWRGLALAGAVVVLLILAALFLPASTFAPVLWSCLAGAATVLGWWARRSWGARFDRQRTARFIDAQAGLDDRLTTLVACPETSTSAPLLAVVVAQALDREASWRPEILVPSALPKAARAAAVTWALAAAVAWWGPRLDASVPAPRQPSPMTGEVDLPTQLADRPPRAADRADGSASAQLGLAPGRDAATPDGDMPSNELAASAADGTWSLSQQLRERLLAQLDEGRSGSAGQGAGEGTAARPPRQPGMGDAAARGDASSPTDGDEPARDEPRSPDASSLAAGGGASAAGEAAAAAPNGASCPPDDATAQRFPLQLTSFLTRAQHGSVAQTGRVIDDAERPEPAIAAEQRPDHPLYRTAVPAELAHVVREAYSWRPLP